MSNTGFQFLVERTELYNAVAVVSRAVSNKTSLPVLNGIYVEVGDFKLKICGYDKEIGIVTEIDVIEYSVGGDYRSVVFGAKLFVDIMRKLPGDMVTITVDEHFKCTIVSDDSKFTLLGIAGGEYPELPSLDEEQDPEDIVVESSLLKDMIDQTVFAVATDETMGVMCGVLFHLDEEKLRLVALDGYRMAIRTENSIGQGNKQFIVGGRTIAEVGKLLIADNNVNISLSERYIKFVVDKYVIISRRLVGEFFDYMKPLGRAVTSRAIVRTNELREMIERLALLIGGETKYPVRFKFENSLMELSVITSIGSADETYAVNFSGENLEIGFKHTYLLDALRVCDVDEIELQFGGSLSPLVIAPANGEEFLFFILPVRIKQ